MKRLMKLNADTHNQLLEDLAADLNGEFQAIEMYDKHINTITDEKIKEKLTEIRDEEIVHSKELKELIDYIKV